MIPFLVETALHLLPTFGRRCLDIGQMLFETHLEFVEFIGLSKHLDLCLPATNRDLAQAVADGDFREDLYYRLKVVELHVPSLRERREDVLPLARILLADAAQRMKRTMTGLAPNVADQLLSYSWPGNVRELQNAMERAVALASGGRVELEDIPEEVRQAPQKPNATTRAVRPLEEIQRDYILDALARNDGNQTQTAAQLEIGSATLYRKLKRYGAINATKRDGRSTKSPARCVNAASAIAERDGSRKNAAAPSCRRGRSIFIESGRHRIDVLRFHQWLSTSKRSAFITLVQAATKSCTNFSLLSSCAYSSA